MRLSRRSLFGWLGSAAVSLALRSPASAEGTSPTVTPLPGFTGPGANPYWNGVNPFVTYPQKLPLLRVTDGKDLQADLGRRRGSVLREQPESIPIASPRCSVG
jgi:hypothetical protein